MYNFHKEILNNIARLVGAAKTLDLHIKTLEMDYRHLHEDFAPAENPEDDEYSKVEDVLESMRHQINQIVLGAVYEASYMSLNPGIPESDG